MKQKIIFICVVIISILYIFVGNKIVTKDNKSILQSQETDLTYRKAKIVKIIQRVETPLSYDGLENQLDINIEFEAKILSGKNKGEVVNAKQNISPFVQTTVKEVEKNDKIVLMLENSEEGNQWYFAEYSRTDALIFLGIIFLVLILIFGKLKGINTIISLVFTCLSIFLVYIPAILSGSNIYLWTIVTCIFITFMTVLIVYGYSKKTLATALRMYWWRYGCRNLNINYE